MPIRRSSSEPVQCSQPQAVLRGGLLASGASVSSIGATIEKHAAEAAVGGGHVTPSGLLQGYRAVTVR